LQRPLESTDHSTGDTAKLTKAATAPREPIMLSAAVAEALKREARRRHISAETFIRSMLEGARDARAGDAALKRHIAGGSETVTLTEVKSRQGLYE